MSEAKPRAFRASSLHTDTGSRLQLPLKLTPNRPKALMEGKECTNNLHIDLLSVLYRIPVICRCFGVPVPGGIAAVTGGTDSENRQRTNLANTIILRSVSESWFASFSFDCKAPPRRATDRLFGERSSLNAKANRTEPFLIAVGALLFQGVVSLCCDCFHSLWFR